jgi:hypothetical protein|tara:strand:+ start:31 stop:1062 length:1032 start_codon:yes stop_codon:yes gene_type:complete
MKIKIEYRPYEILVYLPYDQRARAKNIQGYRWDPNRRAWVYPRETYVALGLMQEFSPDEIEVVTPKYAPPRSAWDFGPDQLEEAVKDPKVAFDLIVELMKESLNLSRESERSSRDLIVELERRSELVKEHKEIIAVAERLLDFKEKVVELASKQGANLESDDELIEFLDMKLASNESPADLIGRAAVAEAKVSALLEELEKIKSESDRKDAPSTLEVIRKIAAPLTEQLPDPQQALANFTLDARGLIVLQNHLDKILREELRKPTSDRSSFNQLIREALDAQVLSMDASRYCHFLRVQRNLFAHSSVPQDETEARTTLGLMGYVLAIRELNKRGDDASTKPAE